MQFPSFYKICTFFIFSFHSNVDSDSIFFALRAIPSSSDLTKDHSLSSDENGFFGTFLHVFIICQSKALLGKIQSSKNPS